MGLISCSECGRQDVSDQSSACPSCGFPLASGTQGDAGVANGEAACEAAAPTPPDEERRALSAGLLTGAQVRVWEGRRKIASGTLAVREDVLWVDSGEDRLRLFAFDEVRGVETRGPRVTLALAERRLTIRFLTHLSQELARRKGALSDLVGAHFPVERTERQPRRGLAWVLIIAVAIAGFTAFQEVQGSCNPPETGGEATSTFDEQLRVYWEAEKTLAWVKGQEGSFDQRLQLEEERLTKLAADAGLSPEQLKKLITKGRNEGWSRLNERTP